MEAGPTRWGGGGVGRRFRPPVRYAQCFPKCPQLVIGIRSLGAGPRLHPRPLDPRSERQGLPWLKLWSHRVPIKDLLVGNRICSPDSLVPRQPRARSPDLEDSTLCKMPAKLSLGPSPPLGQSGGSKYKCRGSNAWQHKQQEPLVLPADLWGRCHQLIPISQMGGLRLRGVFLGASASVPSPGTRGQVGGKGPALSAHQGAEILGLAMAHPPSHWTWLSSFLVSLPY